jgi:hypothetical protein
MITTAKTFYFGIQTGEVVCLDCAGFSLKSALQNKPNAKSWIGAQEKFQVLPSQDVSELAQLGNVCFCKIGK